MSVRERAIKRQREADALWEKRVDNAMNIALEDEELWPLLQWLFYVESQFHAQSFSPDQSWTYYREGQKSIGFAMQTRANDVNWAKWQMLKAQFERPIARNKDDEPAETVIEEDDD